MIYVIYFVIAALVVYLSKKASDYIDLLDKTTNLSGAFLGGILLSTITSLPELFTSLSATLIIDRPDLVMSNILGSNLFNITILSVLILCFFRPYSRAVISYRQRGLTQWMFLMFLSIILLSRVLNLPFLPVIPPLGVAVAPASLAILVCYVLCVRLLAGSEEKEGQDNDEPVTTLTTRAIVVRFTLVAIAIVVLSVILTKVTDEIDQRLHLGAGLAGAIFLGVATSLPEVSSTIALFFKRNYNIAISNIVGSNVFNFCIILVADLSYTGQHTDGVYNFTDPHSLHLLYFGVMAAVFLFAGLCVKTNLGKCLTALAAIACYFAFLLL